LEVHLYRQVAMVTVVTNIHLVQLMEEVEVGVGVGVMREK